MKLTEEDVKKYGTKDELKEIFGNKKPLTKDDAYERISKSRDGWRHWKQRERFTEEYLLTLKDELQRFLRGVEETILNFYEEETEEEFSNRG
jgi:hypothetical protein